MKDYNAKVTRAAHSRLEYITGAILSSSKGMEVRLARSDKFPTNWKAPFFFLSERFPDRPFEEEWSPEELRDIGLDMRAEPYEPMEEETECYGIDTMYQYRWILGTGGPHDELRFYYDRSNMSLKGVDYHYRWGSVVGDYPMIPMDQPMDMAGYSFDGLLRDDVIWGLPLMAYQAWCLHIRDLALMDRYDS